MELPILIVKGAAGLLLKPLRDAVEVKCVVTSAPSYGAFFSGVGDLVSLALNARLHDVIPADGTVVNVNVYIN